MRLRPLRALGPALGLTVGLALALAGCGAAPADDGIASAGGATSGGGATAGPSASAPVDRQEAQLKFAQCMREHGVDIPDPGPDGRVRIIGKKGDEALMEKAMQACRHFMKDAVGDKLGGDDPQARDRMVKFAQCMREHGIDMPDPAPGQGIQVKIKRGQEKAMEEAQKACEELAPGRKP
ncbi:hypothetical protein [Microbispora bryophytorum]|uniref:Secreted protein n=1 Tax=Microbispora bryophytorum TaxID=1460882 RepID=A0A8H9GX37_9ACTN|nr:hypothetical protein [Microbispora bryophytorum]MBD3137378.1 hypothetical protein [Microbispora bryophytorum]TQS06822.1 hypothetical protein FLX07_13250 [Microbispora bryophytorum]GGO08310.1 hypothetical protein GCM10011574_22680 [Microbispora bryophytorum]